jgi:hypothetical protein
LQLKLGKRVPFDAVDSGKYSQEKVRQLLHQQLEDHMQLVTPGARSALEAFDELNKLLMFG